MKKSKIVGDIIWAGIMILIILMLSIKGSRDIFIKLTSNYKYISGFIKFGLLATMGSMLSGRIATKEWKFQNNFIGRTVVWGIIGMWITLTFPIYDTGIKYLMSVGMLPFEGSVIATAFFISFFNNISFAPAFMIIHNATDAYFDLLGEKKKNITIKMVTDKIDLHRFFSFVLLKTVIFFWIPVHTITFLLPSEYRVMFAAMLSIALGILLSIGKKEGTNAIKQDSKLA